MIHFGVMGLGPGTLIGQSVRLKRLLGQGGMGSVWVADHLALQTEVAVKLISAEIAQNSEAVARFQREATAAAQLKSPHVVQIFDHGVMPEGLPYIVMELLEGHDLGRRIQEQGTLPVGEVVSIVSQVCRALGKAHTRGIVHRDIKPENIFLTDSDGELFVKVLDFGIAKHGQDSAMNMTSTGAMVGTPYYMSPEQVMSSKGVDFRSDLWSLAVVAYNALTGRLPFSAETLGALCVAINTASFEPATRVRPDLPASLDTWFERALNRSPDKRFESARSMAETLQAATSMARAPMASSVGWGAGPSTGIASAVTTSGMQTPNPMHTPPAMLSPDQPHTLLDASITGTRTPRSKAALIGIALGGTGLLVIGIAVAAMLSRSGTPETVTSPDPARSPAASAGPGPHASAPVDKLAETAAPQVVAASASTATIPPPAPTARSAPPRPKTTAAATKPIAKAAASSAKQAPARASPNTANATTTKKKADYGF
jgi:eukaryotic-like serine/threonine-protein kinase